VCVYVYLCISLSLSMSFCVVSIIYLLLNVIHFLSFHTHSLPVCSVLLPVVLYYGCHVTMTKTNLLCIFLFAALLELLANNKKVTASEFSTSTSIMNHNNHILRTSSSRPIIRVVFSDIDGTVSLRQFHVIFCNIMPYP